MTPDNFWDHACSRCGLPEPPLPDPDAVMDWSETHTCTKREKAAAA